jgi:hypothetical protein
MQKVLFILLYLGNCLAACTPVVAPVPTTAPFLTPTSDVRGCNDILTTIQDAYPGVNFKIQAIPMPVVDSDIAATIVDCQILSNADATVFQSISTIYSTLSQSLPSAGWSEQTAFRSDAPDGFTTAFLKKTQFCQATATWEPADGLSCPQGKSAADCNLTPEQQMVSLTINCGRLRATNGAKRILNLENIKLLADPTKPNQQQSTIDLEKDLAGGKNLPDLLILSNGKQPPVIALQLLNQAQGRAMGNTNPGLEGCYQASGTYSPQDIQDIYAGNYLCILTGEDHFSVISIDKVEGNSIELSLSTWQIPLEIR